jgi:hypothetical protein
MFMTRMPSFILVPVLSLALLAGAPTRSPAQSITINTVIGSNSVYGNSSTPNGLTQPDTPNCEPARKLGIFFEQLGNEIRRNASFSYVDLNTIPV